MSGTPSNSRSGLRELFDELIELPAQQRNCRIAAAGLDEEHASNLQAMVAFHEIVECVPKLRAGKLTELELPEKVHTRVRAMLAANSKVPDWQSDIAHSWKSCRDADVLAQSLVGTSIGDFRLLALIGQGGSSAVFRAERDAGDASQIVALKVLRTGLYSEDAQRRFRREQGILAQLSHENIASLIEGGVSSAGIPYIAMELVDGLPITLAADARNLSIEARLRWFFNLCRTIEAAHAMLIVHRDLKPSNLLVTKDGKLKVLDFGIARLTDSQDEATRTQSMALTPGYAAPEQYTSTPLTTAVDVYALGVLLGELLTGKRLKGSTRASNSLGVKENAGAPLPRGLPSRSILARRLRGDLDAILACALADDPALRYHSAAAFGDDIGRYLAAKPVRAHPPSGWYRTNKFLSRHRLVVALSSIFLVALVAALGVALWQADAANTQARAASEQAQRAEAARDLLVSVFQAGNAELPREKRLSVQDVVEQATARLITQNALPDGLRADLLLTLAKVSDSVGSYDQALALLDHAAPILQSRTHDAFWWDAVVFRGTVLVHKSLYAEAVALLDPLSAELRARRDETGINGLLMLGYAVLHCGRIDQGLAVAHDAVVIAREEIARMPAETLLAMNSEASLLLDAMRFSDGFRSADAALALWRQQGASPCQWMISLYENIAVAAEASGDIARAEDAYKEAIEQGKRYFDKPSPSVAWDTGMYGTFLIAQGRLDEAEPYARKGLELRQTVFGEADPHTLNAVAGMAKLYIGRHDFAAAISWNTQGIDLCRANNLRVLICARLLALRGRSFGLNGQFAEADKDLDEALESQRTLSGDATPDYAYILDNRLIVQVARHDYDDAIATADRILTLRAAVDGGMLQADLSTRFRRAQALFEVARNDDALGELIEVEPKYSSLVPKGDLRFDMLALKARALARAHRMREASDAAQRALALDKPWGKPDSHVIEELKHLAGTAKLARR